ncbi:MAG: hypothetical protein EBW92_02905 [Candidatus Fonsibacter ubiquis]|nr:hypothetical protein [Candidatus Fonsibacter ubiquis]
MDIIPPSLAIAQAAYESGWGTSRFAIEGNALFGQWSWKENNGMIPEDRGEDEKHEISKFNQIRYAVSAYKNNLNTHPFYEEFRKERARQRAGRLSGSISGMKLIEHVHKYSIRGNDYVLGLKKIIEQNALQDFDKANSSREQLILPVLSLNFLSKLIRIQFFSIKVIFFLLHSPPSLAKQLIFSKLVISLKNSISIFGGLSDLLMNLFSGLKDLNGKGFVFNNVKNLSAFP